MQTNKGFALLWILVCVAAGLLFFLFAPRYLFPNESEYSTENVGQDSINFANVATYKSPYWGFSISYPNNFTVYEVPEGVRIYNYDRPNKPNNYHPMGDELLIKINSFMSETQIADSVSSHNNKFSDVTVMEKKFDVHKQIVKGNFTAINSQITNDKFTYYFSAEPATPEGITTALSILSSLEFIPNELFQTSKTSLPQGLVRYEDNRLGFAIDYPSRASIKRSRIGGGFISIDEKYVSITYLLRNNSSDSWLENAKQGIPCSASVPGSDLYSDPDKMIVNKYTSNYGAEGYKIERTTLHTKNGTIVNEVKDNVYVFPLSIQEYEAVAIGPAQQCLDKTDPQLDEATETITRKFQLLSK